MKIRTAILACCMTAALLWGCNTPKTHKVLSYFFDGVPEPGKAPGGSGVRGDRKGAVPVPGTAIRYREHGPYAAKMCQDCHGKGTSSLILPIDELCFQCHSVDVRKKYIHGPIASGGCKVCHQPHGSIYPFLLVSEPKEFCLYCHDRNAIAGNDAHSGVDSQCTTCHDAHSSDERYLLK